MLHGTLTVLTDVSGGLTAAGVSGNGTGTVVLTGTATQINTTLAASNGLVYLEQGDHTSDTLTVDQDQGTYRSSRRPARCRYRHRSARRQQHRTGLH